jgi:hypothetical protein
MPFIYQVNTHAMDIKSIKNNSIAMFSLKTLNLGGIRTRAYFSLGGYGVHEPDSQYLDSVKNTH